MDDKWKLLRYYIAKEVKEIEDKYLQEGSTGAKADEAKLVRRTLHNVWNAMDEIEKAADTPIFVIRKMEELK